MYEVSDRTGVRQAIKVVTKDSLKTKKAKTKAREYPLFVTMNNNS